MSGLKQKYDSSTVAVMRQALDEVIADRRFLVRKSITPLEVAEHILQQAASGERDLNSGRDEIIWQRLLRNLDSAELCRGVEFHTMGRA